ncbi:hypothetical protein Q1695_007354 [Nippostrongylus brasiliensis]|nr:hypothetical protein Q1695_007354 [Nippostrongylus brasiliensis]
MEIQVQNCSTKTCQCPGDKVENESGQCVDPELCPSNRRRRRYTDALAAISPKVARYLCLIRRDCAKTGWLNRFNVNSVPRKRNSKGMRQHL